jgi:hypothetical protein
VKPTQDSIYATLAIITPGILARLMNERGITDEAAGELLYTSELYAKLEDEETKLWHLSSACLYDLLEEELTTGSITWPEEQ